MRNKRILYGREQVKIYESYYKPSFNPFRFLKSILAVLLSGSAPVARSYVHMNKRMK